VSTLDKSRIGEVVEACVENMNRLTQWERNFIENISDQWERKRWLSDKQEEILERIYVDKIP
jgi:hypothetical protein